MLRSLHIANYAIINHLEIELNAGLNIVTGETGAGKSILLGALSLLLGQRADTSVLKDKKEKCIVEGSFDITKYNLKDFFDQNDLDYDDYTIIRRDIASNGKSRAFVNDVPVNLSVLKELGVQLIDIHSQHQNLNLQNNDFQVKVLDILAGTKEMLNDFKQQLSDYKQFKSRLALLKEEILKLEKDKAFFEFQFDELEKANIGTETIEALEEESNTLSHAGEIKQLLTENIELLQNQDVNILTSLKIVQQNLSKLKSFTKQSEAFAERVESSYIELKDIADEMEILNDKAIVDPERLEIVNNRLNIINSLMQKHRVTNLEDLIKVKNDYQEKLDNINFSGEKTQVIEQQIEKRHKDLKASGDAIRKMRLQATPLITGKVNDMLKMLGMQSCSFDIKIEKTDSFTNKGSDEIKFLFSSGKGLPFQDLAKTASGGEISRLMLSIKSLMTRYVNLPTIIFDEIDTGISGEIADKMGNIIKQISKDMQVLNITHLPQVASKGDYHFLVHKIDKEHITETQMKLLTHEERVNEVAKMLSGAELTEAAIQNAKVLLDIK